MAHLHRIDQLLTRCGYCSRSEARSWVRAGRVTIQGVAVRSPDQKARPSEVAVDGEALEAPDGLLALLHKPLGVVCSHDAREGPSVYDLLPDRWCRRHPGINTVGRLDRDTTGVLLITDVGEWLQHWTSPRKKVTKVYEVTVDGVIPPEIVPFFASGTLKLPDEETPCAPAHLELVGPHQARLELTEGRYHQVKRMFSAAGLQVTRLHRSRFGEYTVMDLEPGTWRVLPNPQIG